MTFILSAQNSIASPGDDLVGGTLSVLTVSTICLSLTILFIIWCSFSFSYSTDPPSPPIVSGYVEGSIIPAGSVQKLLCVSSGGNPLATLTWFKNDKKVRRRLV